MVLKLGMDEESKVSKRTKEFRRSKKVRKAMDRIYLRDLSTFKYLSKFSKLEQKLESRKATDEDFQADQLFYEEMGMDPDEFVEENVYDSYEKTHTGSFKGVEDFSPGDQVSRLPIKIDDKVIAQPSDDVEMQKCDVPDESDKEKIEEIEGAEDEDDDVGSFLSFEMDDEEEDNEENAALTTSNDKDKAKYLKFLEKREKYMREAKIKIANLSQSICEDPQTSYTLLTSLVALLNRDKIRSSTVLTKLLLLSITEVFKDIVPGYKIRELTAEEKKVKVKKDTKLLRKFEAGLVKDYQTFLKHLEAIVTSKVQLSNFHQNKKNLKKAVKDSDQLLIKQVNSVKVIAAQCVRTLLVNLSNFNFRTNVVKMSTLLASGSNQELSSIASDAISQTFLSDQSGEVSLEIMFYLEKVLVKKKFRVNACCLRTFLSLPITEINYARIREYQASEKKKKKERRKAENQSKLKKKAAKVEEKWIRELDELSTKENRGRIDFLHGKIIGLVFACYFRVLKRSPNSAILEVVLEGVAKLGHLIGVEFYDDLMTLMKGILQRDDLTHKQRLHCILSVFRLITGDMQLLNVDMQQFNSYLYESLLALDEVRSEDFHFALDTLDEILSRSKKTMIPSRLLALCKRLFTLLLSVDSESALRMFPTISKTITNQSDQLLSEETVGSGAYNPYVNDPDFANAQNTAVWELSLLSNHYCAPVKSSAHIISQLKHIPKAPDIQDLSEYMYHEELKYDKLERGELTRNKRVKGTLRYPEKLLKLDDLNEK